MLRRRLILIGLLMSLMTAALGLAAIDRLRAHDRRLALERVAAAFLTDLVRVRCEANPNWFLAGPRENAPSAALLAQPDSETIVHRPDVTPRGFEYFAYDSGFIGQSTAAPRFPEDMRAVLRSSATVITAPLSTSEGTGVQIGVVTNWSGPCAVLLFRMHPQPRQLVERAAIFVLLAVAIFVVAMLVAVPIDRRVCRIAAQMRESARTEYQDPAPVRGRDELSGLGFAFNEAGKDIRRLMTDARDREADVRRQVAHLISEVSEPLRIAAQAPGQRPLQPLALHLANLLVGARLRDASDRVQLPVDVSSITATVLQEFDAASRASGVHVDVAHLDPKVALVGDPAFFTQAVRNLLAFALQRAAGGRRISVNLTRVFDGRFTLRVIDTGPDLPDEELRQLNAVRRFRGDEGRTDLRGDIGLNLAIVHEVCHRFALQLTFRRAAAGGFEAELSS